MNEYICTSVITIEADDDTPGSKPTYRAMLKNEEVDPPAWATMVTADPDLYQMGETYSITTKKVVKVKGVIV